MSSCSWHSQKQYESKDSITLSAINEHLEKGLAEFDTENTYIIGKPRQNKTVPRPIIIKFVRYNCRRRAFLNKKNLKTLGYISQKV